MLKEMIIEVKRIVYSTYVVNEENGFEMPVGTKDTVEFINSVKNEIEHSQLYKPEESEEHFEITEIKYIDK